MACRCLRPDKLGATTIEPVMDLQAMVETVVAETEELISTEVRIFSFSMLLKFGAAHLSS